MTKNDICIVIPIYKKELNSFEIQSVEQCIHILSDYRICFVCPNNMNTDFYRSRFPRITKYVYFKNNYFTSLEGYNKLMLSPSFYRAFRMYKYMLLYQTDCYVFRDELLVWAKKGYDYIGGIWFEDYHLSPHKGAKIWYPGNGGLSLRNIESIYKLLSSRKPIKDYKQLQNEKEQLKENDEFSQIRWNLLLPFRLLGYQNNFNYISKNYKINEDVFFMEACVIHQIITTPNVHEAIGFSWDKYPKYLFEVLKYPIPFCCHAWYRDENEYKENRRFWVNHINRIENKSIKIDNE